MAAGEGATGQQQQQPSVGGRGINPGSWVRRASAAEESEDDEIPEDWGWPREPYSLEALRAHVEAVVTEGATGSAAAAEEEGGLPRGAWPAPDPRAFERGRWYRLGDVSGGGGPVFVHSHTRDITAERPKNCAELTDKEKRLLGTLLTDLPPVLQRVYGQRRKIPLVYGTEAACHAWKSYATYSQDSQLLDTGILKRVNERSLEECRRSIIAAMKNGTKLCVFIGDYICDFQEKVCIPKNRGKFPVGLFTYGGLESDLVKDHLFSEEDREGGQCTVREGFMVYLLVAYGDGGGALEIPSARRDELRKIPNFDYMEEVRCHCDEDRLALLQEQLRRVPP